MKIKYTEVFKGYGLSEDARISKESSEHHHIAPGARSPRWLSSCQSGTSLHCTENGFPLESTSPIPVEIAPLDRGLGFRGAFPSALHGLHWTVADSLFTFKNLHRGGIKVTKETRPSFIPASITAGKLQNNKEELRFQQSP